VTSNLSALEVGTIHAVGCIGDDGEGYELRRGLARTRVDVTHLLVREDWFTPTYTKPMVRQPDGSEVESNRQDIKNRGETPREIIYAVIAELRAVVPKVQAVIVADQVEAPNEGLITAVDTLADYVAEAPAPGPGWWRRREVSRHFEERLREGTSQVHVVDALGAALALHEVRTVNMVMTGAASHFLPLTEEAYVEALKVRLPARFEDVNVRAFRAGRALIASPQPGPLPGPGERGG
jgi:hypothetical protein